MTTADITIRHVSAEHSEKMLADDKRDNRCANLKWHEFAMRRMRILHVHSEMAGPRVPATKLPTSSYASVSPTFNTPFWEESMLGDFDINPLTGVASIGRLTA